MPEASLFNRHVVVRNYIIVSSVDENVVVVVGGGDGEPAARHDNL